MKKSKIVRFESCMCRAARAPGLIGGKIMAWGRGASCPNVIIHKVPNKTKQFAVGKGAERARGPSSILNASGRGALRFRGEAYVFLGLQFQ